MGRTHILTQFIWPDGAPTGIYAEQLAVRLAAHGKDVVLVGGEGQYRAEDRPRPQVPIATVPHWRGARHRLTSVFREYVSVERGFRVYLRSHVRPGDVVVATSAPPNSVRLAPLIHRSGARAVYWLQDYYPELVRGIVHPPRPLRFLLSRWFDQRLARWDRVVKCGGNLGYRGTNATVIRNWPTIRFQAGRPPATKVALYSGNLGYGHDVRSFIERCDELRGEGYRVVVRGDGPGVSALPAWIEHAPPVQTMAELERAYLEAEVHLVAAHPEIQHAIFPSKLWNSLASGRRIVYSGFTGAMKAELDESLRCAWDLHLNHWETLLDAVEA